MSPPTFSANIKNEPVWLTVPPIAYVFSIR